MKIKCPQCGFENEEGSKFCKKCYIPLSKQDYSEDNPYLKIVEKKEETVEEKRKPDNKKGREKDPPFELTSNEEDKEDNVVYKCPKCNATIEEGLKLCGNCKAEIVWKDGKPRLSIPYAMQKVGCALTQLGCLIPLLIIFVFAAYVIITSLLKT